MNDVGDFRTLADERTDGVARRPVAMFYRAALACRQPGSQPDGLDRLQQAIEEFRSINHLGRLPYYLSVLADAFMQRGRVDDAEATIRAALDVAREHSEDWCRPELLRIQAAIVNGRGRVNEAEALLVESLALAQKIGALSWRLRAASDLARLWSSRSKPDAARAMLLPIFNEFTEGFSTLDLVIARSLLAPHTPQDGDVSAAPEARRATARSIR